MEELIKDKDLDKIWKKVGMDKVIDDEFKGEDEQVITKKELTKYTKLIVKNIFNVVGNEMLKELKD